MEFLPLSRCKSDLDFKPIKVWPSCLPVPVYDFQRLAGFERSSDEKGLDLSHEAEFAEVFLEIHPQLSFVEASELALKLSRIESLKKWAGHLLSAWGWHLNEYLWEMVELVTELPPSLRQNFADKKMSPRDLEPLKLVSDYSYLASLSDSTILSRSEWSQFLDLYSQLVGREDFQPMGLMGKTSQEILQTCRRLRFPRRSVREDNMQLKSKTLSWPKGSRQSWNFQLDQPQLELRFKLGSLQDLKKLVPQMEKVSHQAEGDGNPWA